MTFQFSVNNPNEAINLQQLLQNEVVFFFENKFIHKILRLFITTLQQYMNQQLLNEILPAV